MTQPIRDILIAKANEQFVPEIVDFIEQQLRPAVAIQFDEEGRSNSRFGGLPSFAAGERWPTYNTSGMCVGQIDLAELPAEIRQYLDIPARGLVRLFTPVHEDYEEFFWGDPGFVKALYTNNSVTDASAWPDDLDEAYRTNGVPVRFEFAWHLPRYDVLVDEWPLGEYEDQYDEFLDECCPVGHLFGYTDFTSLAYDPTPEGTIPFLTLTSRDELDWCWNDGDYLQTFISREALASGDFSNISSDAG